MLSKSAEVFAKSLGLKITETCAFGIYGNYFLSIYETKSKKTIKISCYIGNSEEYSDDYLNITDGLRSVLGKYTINDYSVAENGITIITSAPLTSLREMVDYVVGLLADNEIPDSHFCSGCGTEFKASEKRKVVTIAKGTAEDKRLLCEQCALTAAEENQNAEIPEEEGSKPDYRKGILLSTLAGIGISVLYILIFFLFGITGRSEIGKFFTCLVAFFIGGVVFVVYRVAAKQTDAKGMLAICIETSVLCLAAHYFGCVFGLAKYLHTSNSISYTTFRYKFTSYLSMQFTDEKNLRFLVIGFIISLCAAFIAVILLYSSDFKKSDMKRQTKVTIQTVK
jgi:hypothetical protein